MVSLVLYITRTNVLRTAVERQHHNITLCGAVCDILDFIVGFLMEILSSSLTSPNAICLVSFCKTVFTIISYILSAFVKLSWLLQEKTYSILYDCIF